jgi:uncharacterized delta-60 repeat protein
MRSNGVERVAGRKSSLLAAAAILGLAWMVGCGDGDDSEPNSNDDGGSAGDSSGGKGGTNASGGTSGSGATGGDGSGATGGDPTNGSGATGGDPTSGSGGSGAETGETGGAGGSDGDPDPVGGNGGEGGDDGVPNYNLKKLNGPNGTLVPGVHDLRGLVFSASGKIYASGFVGFSTAYPNASDRQVAIVRFNADGTLDSSWDGDGIRTLNLRTRQGIDDAVTNDGDEYSIGLVELANKQIVVSVNVRDASGKGRDVALIKFTEFGGQVNFGTGGSAVAVKKVNFGWTDADNASYPGAPNSQPVDESWGIALDKSTATEKIVVFGYGPSRKLTAEELAVEPAPVQRTDNDRYVVRVNASDGNIDAGFNGGKPFTFNTTGTSSDGGRRGIVLADGSIVSSGYTNLAYNGGNTVVILGLKPDGTADPKFTYGIPADAAASIPGVYFGNPFKVNGGIAECYGVTRQSTGRFVTTGYGRATAANTASTLGWATTDAVDMVSIAFTTAEAGGAPDTTFGSSSTFAVQSEGLGNVSTEDRGRDVIALADDRLVFAGRLGDYPAIFVATADGELDSNAGGLGAGPNGTDTIEGAYTYPALSPVAGAPNFYQVAVSPDGKRIAATTSNHPDGAVLAIIDVE